MTRAVSVPEEEELQGDGEGGDGVSAADTGRGPAGQMRGRAWECSDISSLCFSLPPFHWLCHRVPPCLCLFPQLSSDLGFRGLGSVLTGLEFTLLPGEDAGLPLHYREV